MKITQTLIFVILITFITQACVSRQTVANPNDPFERFNRTMFAINTGIDRLAIRPVASCYDTFLPTPIKNGVTNFFNNLRMIIVFPNDLLQGKIQYALIDLWRFAINSTLGIGGLVDVAYHVGVPPHYQDFALTMAYWDGGKSTPYVFLPVLGPGGLREYFGLGIDYLNSPYPYINPAWVRWAAMGLQMADVRSRLLPADKLIRQSFDPYVFVRDAYVQKRRQMIEDNKKPFEQSYNDAKAAMGGKPARFYPNFAPRSEH